MGLVLLLVVRRLEPHGECPVAHVGRDHSQGGVPGSVSSSRSSDDRLMGFAREFPRLVGSVARVL